MRHGAAVKIPLYQVDAFTDRVFGGNPAAVCPLERWLPDEVLQAVAAENNLSETAYFVRDGEAYELRWFTPQVEVDLCGHATLATAHVLFERLGYAKPSIVFTTRKAGHLSVRRSGDLLTLDFPARPPQRREPLIGLTEALGATPTETWQARDVMALFADAEQVRALKPDFGALAKLDAWAVIVTAPGDAGVDFVSRFFAPAKGVPEDPVTGSAHCTLTPYWAGRLGKTSLYARQVSKRGGTLWCTDNGERVEIAGRAATYLEGTIQI